MNMVLLAKYWQEIVLAVIMIVLSLMVLFMTFMLRDATNTIKLMRVNHSLEIANNLAEANKQIAIIERTNNERWQNAVNENIKSQAIIADSYSSNSAIVNSLSATIDEASSRYIEADATARAEYTTALTNISKDCIGEITELSRVADGHVADIRMLQRAWPTK